MTFQVRHVDSTEYTRLERIANRFERMASEAYPTLEKTSLVYEQMLNSENICYSLLISIREGYCDPSIKFYIAEGKKRIPQALMMAYFCTDEIYIKYLASCPWNIAPVPNDRNFCEKGAATALMMHILQQASDCGKSIRLHSYPEARSFYERFGLLSECVAKEDSRGSQMSISVEKIRSLYPQYVPLAAA